jgi:hypothetical protein
LARFRVTYVKPLDGDHSYGRGTARLRPEADRQRLSATLAGVEARQFLEAGVEGASLIQSLEAV